MRFRLLCIPFLMAVSVGWITCESASGQGFLKNLGNQLGGQIGEQIRREIPRVVNGSPPNRSTPNPGNPGGPPQIQSMDIPSESGRENVGRPGFRSDDFFTPGPSQPPRVIQQPPRTTSPNLTYPPQTYPNQTYPTQTFPSRTYPGQTQPRQTYRSQTYPPNSSARPPTKSVSVSNQKFKLRCPRSLSQSVSYQLLSNGRAFPFTMNPGEAHKIVEAQVWRIRYTSNGREVSYRLRGGATYEFERDANGQLQLFREPETDVEPPLRSSDR